jgi:tRNA1Val (adenine37-N6)-methyltransferase
MKYSQPDFYRFNEDSLKLVSFVVDNHEFSSSAPISVLDLCCGCGVIGIEFFLKSKKLGLDFAELTFIEKNKKFQEFLEYNQRQFLSDENFVNNFFMDLNKFSQEKKYSLILSNPPYYSQKKFRMSENHDRNQARSYSDDFFKSYFAFFEKNLIPEGRAYFLCLDENKDITFDKRVKKEIEIGQEVSLFSWSSSE